MHMCQITETERELIYVQGKDIEASSSNGKTFFIVNNCSAQRYYKYYFENAYSIYISMQPAF